MPSELIHSPADILRYLFIVKGTGTLPLDSGAWPINVAQQPSDPDECITLFDTVGVQHGRTAPDKERNEHHGVQLLVRSADHATGWAKARAVAVAADKNVLHDLVTIGSDRYCVKTVVRRGGVLALGSETPLQGFGKMSVSKRLLFSVNFTTHIVPVP